MKIKIKQMKIKIKQMKNKWKTNQYKKQYNIIQYNTKNNTKTIQK